MPDVPPGGFKKNPIDALDQETLLTINKFFEHNLNVSETARKLFVHRHTLVYRLGKIKKLTGLDLREFDDAITFKVALMVKKYLIPGESSPDNCTECKMGPLSAARRTEALFLWNPAAKKGDIKPKIAIDKKGYGCNLIGHRISRENISTCALGTVRSAFRVEGRGRRRAPPQD